MILTHHREKLIDAIVYFAENTKFCGKTKLMKLLYYLDFWHFKETGKSVTGLDYYTWERGPVPKALFVEIDNMQPDLKAAIKIVLKGGLQEISARRKFDDRFFTSREKRLLEEVSFIFREARAEDISHASHLKNAPWDRTLKEKGEWAKIDYLLSIDDDARSLSFEEAKERMEEIEETHRLLGTA
jgi:uncharacterized phage-associated protein